MTEGAVYGQHTPKAEMMIEATYPGIIAGDNHTRSNESLHSCYDNTVADAGQTRECSSLKPLGPWRENFSEQEKAQWRMAFWQHFRTTALTELASHAVPLTLLVALIACPWLRLVWFALALLWWISESAYRRLPKTTQIKIVQLFPDRWRQSRVFSELIDGMRQMRPFLLVSLYLVCIPFALAWMYGHWILRLNRPAGAADCPDKIDSESVTLILNKRHEEEEEEANFIHSPAFALTSLLFFVSGLPAFLTLLLYRQLGVDASFGFPSLDPNFIKVFLVNGLYFYSVGWCVSVLFFRSWFTFPLNFLGNEEAIEINQWGVRRRNRSWFTQVLTLNSPGSGAPSLAWQEIVALRPNRMRSPFYPLPAIAFPQNSFMYRLLNRFALLADGLYKTQKKPECIYFTTKEKVETLTGTRVALGREIRINLADLEGDERTRLFWAVRRWAPHVVVDEEVQKQMIGTSGLQEPRYTELWFELLTDDMPARHSGVLPSGTILKKGELAIKQRLCSGGQTNVYIAEINSGEQVILKEFILSTSDTVGALVESAGDFETEASLLFELEHERIVKMFSFFAENRRLYIELEKIPGKSLRQLIKESGPLTEQQTIQIAMQVLEVLEYLHGKTPPVIHRDITPDNIILTEDRGVTIIDFSLAASKKFRRTTTTMGKHSYAPPEQFRDQPCAQSDIYSLGATMYFLLTGQDPEPITPAQVSARRSDVSRQLDEIIHRATAFELTERIQSAVWFKLDLLALEVAKTEESRD